jgi:hypothetical protein
MAEKRDPNRLSMNGMPSHNMSSRWEDPSDRVSFHRRTCRAVARSCVHG